MERRNGQYTFNLFSILIYIFLVTIKCHFILVRSAKIAKTGNTSIGKDVDQKESLPRRLYVETVWSLGKTTGRYLLMLNISIYCHLEIPHPPPKAYVRMFIAATS